MDTKINPSVSVIVPVYNVEAYLRTCVDSVLCQTYRDFELLLIDDGSTDASGSVCDDYAHQDARVRVFHKSNGGSSSARNRGLEEARGEWVVFLDSDDAWSSPDALARLCTYAVRNKLDVLRFEYQGVDDELTPNEQKDYAFKNALRDRVLINSEFVSEAIHGEWFGVLFLLRRVMIGALRFDEKVHFLEDMEFYSRLLASGEYRCGYLDEALYLYRRHAGTLSTRPCVARVCDSFRMCDVFWEQSRGTRDDRLRRLYEYYSVMMYYWTLQTLASDPYFGDGESIAHNVGLEMLHSKVRARMTLATIRCRYWPFVLPAPAVGVRLLRLKDKLRMLAR